LIGGAARALDQSVCRSVEGAAGLLLLVAMGIAPIATSQTREAGELRARLIYGVAESISGCPSEADLRQLVAQQLGRDAFAEPAGRIVLVSIQRIDESLVARVTIEDEGGSELGRREFQSSADDCDGLVHSLALAIYLSLKPIEAAAALPVPAVEVAQQTASAIPTVEPIPPMKPRLNGYLGPEASFLTSPQIALGVMAGARLGWPGFTGALEAHVDFPTSMQVNGGEVSVALEALDMVPCIPTGWVSFCGVLAIGAEQVAASGLPQSRRQSVPYFAAGPRVVLAIPTGWRIGWQLQVDALVPLKPLAVRVGSQEVWSSPAISLSLGFAVGLEIL
jgi:hypothetical protein